MFTLFNPEIPERRIFLGKEPVWSGLVVLWIEVY